NELSVHGKLLWGEPTRISMPPATPPQYDLRRDGLRLRNNRIVEHLRTRVQYETGEADHLQMLYSLNKFWIEIATSLSVFTGCYAPSYRERAERLANVLDSLRAGPLSRVAEPLHLRLQQSGLHGAASQLLSPEISELTLGPLLSEAAAVAARLWWWETGHILGDDPEPADWRQIAWRLRRIQTRSQRVREWGRLLLRSDGWPRITFQAMPAVIRAGSLGNAIYAAGCALAFFWDD